MAAVRFVNGFVKESMNYLALMVLLRLHCHHFGPKGLNVHYRVGDKNILFVAGLGLAARRSKP